MLRVFESQPAALITEHPLSLHTSCSPQALARMKQRWVYVFQTPNKFWEAWTNDGEQRKRRRLVGSFNLTSTLQAVNRYCNEHSMVSQNDLQFLNYTLRWEEEHGTESN